MFFPWGWQATVDGKPAEIGRINYLLRAIKIPAGEHTIEMVFDPASLHSTTTVAYVSIILIYLASAGAIACLFAGRRRKEGSSPLPESGSEK